MYNHFESVEIAQESRAVSASCDFFDPAAAVDVDEVGSDILGDAGCFLEGFAVATVELDGDGAFFVGDLDFFDGAFDVAAEGFAIGEFGVDDIGAAFFADLAEGNVGDVFHRREADGVFEFHFSDGEHGAFPWGLTLWGGFYHNAAVVL